MTGCLILACPPVIRPGVSVVLRSAVTGEPISGAAVTLVDGAYTETMVEGDPGSYTGSWGRAGTYTLTARAPGFADLSRGDIEATVDECGVSQTVDLDLEMSPAS